MSAIFKPEHVGQVVSDPRYGNGVIFNFEDEDTYKVKVRFTHTSDSFTVDGRTTENALPTLQFGNLDNYERKLTPYLQDGQYVQVPIDQDTWVVKMVRILDGIAHYVNTTKTDGTECCMPLTTWRCAL